MTDLPQRIVLRGDRNWQKASELFQAIKANPAILCDVTFRVCEDLRTLQQNAKLHAICGDIAKQKKWDGEYRDTEAWKRIMVAGWMKATGRKIEMVSSLDGEDFVPLYQQTSRLSIPATAELIEFVIAWCVDNEIKLNEDNWQG